MKSLKLTASATVGVLFALAPMSIQVQAQNQRLEFIEFSDTLLTATLGTVNNVGPDHWQWRSGAFGNTINLAGLGRLWEEPSGETGVNSLDDGFFDLAGGSYNLGLEIFSDDQRYNDPGFPKNANGSFGFTYTAYSSSGVTVFGPVDVYFTDRGDSSSKVPDTSSTLGLLLVSTAALFGASRLRAPARC